ncbi:MAG: hypothetical protein ABIO48_13225 [Pedococcus sp.]
MPSVAITSTTSQPLLLPSICVKTGEPTDDVLRVRGSAAPEWTTVMVVFGLFAWLFAQTMSSRRYNIVLPFDSAVLRRYRKWRRAAWSCAGVGVVLTVVAAGMGSDYSSIPLLVALLGALAMGVGNEWANSVGVRLARDGSLVLTRVHPRFAAAVPEGERDRLLT